jgi:cytidylate kinase
MTAITISREIGSEGTHIATQAARTLGYHIADKDVMERVLRQYGLNQFVEDVDGALPAFWVYFDQELMVTTGMLDQTIKALAQHGNVIIIGRGGYAALRGLADVLHVRIQAPRPIRVRRVIERQGMSLREAEARVTEGDRVRTGFIERAYHVRSDDVRAFDLVINTGKIGPDLAAGLIVEAVQALGQQTPSDVPTAAGIKVNSTLAHVVSEALGCEVESHQALTRT